MSETNVCMAFVQQVGLSFDTQESYEVFHEKGEMTQSITKSHCKELVTCIWLDFRNSVGQ